MVTLDQTLKVKGQAAILRGCTDVLKIYTDVKDHTVVLKELKTKLHQVAAIVNMMQSDIYADVAGWSTNPILLIKLILTKYYITCPLG